MKPRRWTDCTGRLMIEVFFKGNEQSMPIADLCGMANNGDETCSLFVPYGPDRSAVPVRTDHSYADMMAVLVGFVAAPKRD